MARAGVRILALLQPKFFIRSLGADAERVGDEYLRRLLVVGMTSLIRRAKYKPETVDPWLADLLSRKPARLVTVALANKAAQVVWAIMVGAGVYRMPAGASVTTSV